MVAAPPSQWSWVPVHSWAPVVARRTPPGRSQVAIRRSSCGWGVARHVNEGVEADDPVERAVGKRDVVGIGVQESGLRHEFAGAVDLGGHVTDRRGPAPAASSLTGCSPSVSPETVYQARYGQGRGALRRETAAALRTGRAIRHRRRGDSGAAAVGLGLVKGPSHRHR